MSKFTEIVGWWKVLSTDMKPDVTLSLIGGLPGEYVCFDDNQRFFVHPESGGNQFYECKPLKDYASLDIHIVGLEPLGSRSIVRVNGDRMTICIAGRALGEDGELPRPDKFERDDEKNWVTIEYQRSSEPKVGLLSRLFGSRKKNQGLIPKGFLD